MRSADINSYKKDIAEALQEVGTVNGDVNITWHVRLHTDYDKTYKVATTALFQDYEITGAVSTINEADLYRLEGMDVTKISKVIISALEFERIGIIPRIEDRLTFDGIIYNVVGMPFASHIGTTILYYFIYIQESSFIAQSEEYREQKDPYFEVDASQEEWETNTSAINSLIMASTPAIIRGTKVPPFSVIADYNDRIELVYGVDAQIITIPASTYATAAVFVSVLQASVDVAFGASILLVTTNLDRIHIQTIAVGPAITLALVSLISSCYSVVGMVPVTVTGGYVPLQVENTFYSDGDPVYDNG